MRVSTVAVCLGTCLVLTLAGCGDGDGKKANSAAKSQSPGSPAGKAPGGADPAASGQAPGGSTAAPGNPGGSAGAGNQHDGGSPGQGAAPTCLVGSWHSKTIGLGGRGGDAPRLDGGDGVVLEVGADGAAKVDFGKMKPVAFNGSVFGKKLGGEMTYSGTAAATLGFAQHPAGPGGRDKGKNKDSDKNTNGDKNKNTTKSDADDDSDWQLWPGGGDSDDDWGQLFSGGGDWAELFGGSGGSGGGDWSQWFGGDSSKTAWGSWKPTGTPDWSHVKVTIKLTAPVASTVLDNADLTAAAGKDAGANGAAYPHPVFSTGAYMCTQQGLTLAAWDGAMSPIWRFERS